ncbi:ornithine cyclodeaminase [Rhodobacter aestuarii]|uniref:Ornithine cyclodeaminase n=1 Tax=Rhodobacter aestuarii TaxID=453582 RepID=A0A1N7LP03_9RHOB|nr:ornithine cyclodeaminase [Rhodobacter aestuarii]PTV95130.1 ornithine cyclodeaminase [Rhodobacter aestuarii]SIS75512.1 ornithine cyclodeaminase [Rhodobacter aestuarii]
MTPAMIGPEAEAKLDWIALTDALAAGHALPRPEVADSFLYRGKDTLLTRSAVIDGLGMLVKAATIVPGNAPDLATVNGGVMLMNNQTGLLDAVLDFGLVTKWKTAGDSLLAARRLARPEARNILICGAGNVAASMISAYRAAFPEASFTIWNRSPAGAEALADRMGAAVEMDLETALGQAEIVAGTTMAKEPWLRGDWLQSGTHVDLIGAFRPDMREADDVALKRARIFCDARATTVHHIGEFRDPIARGVLAETEIVADYYDLGFGTFARQSAEEITLCKNGGGAHLDLMTARYILDAVQG